VIDRNRTDSTVDDSRGESDPLPPDRRLTIPNALCLVRLFGSLAIIPAAIADRPRWVLVLFVALATTDWIDGKLARALDQRSRIGPKLDSLADITMYAMLLFALVWLKSDVLVNQWPWLVPAGVLFVVACGGALWKFGSLPSYHTRSAKTTWFLTLVAAVALFLDGPIWPFRLALVSISIANLESIAITATLSRPMTDVISIFAARRLRRQQRDESHAMEGSIAPAERRRG
jgi:CDP-diacylglycerol--glycerol-3-phosphate 3-phosphatidyltransferase